MKSYNLPLYEKAKVVLEKKNELLEKILGYESALDIAKRSGIIKNINSENVLAIG